MLLSMAGFADVCVPHLIPAHSSALGGPLGPSVGTDCGYTNHAAPSRHCCGLCVGLPGLGVQEEVLSLFLLQRCCRGKVPTMLSPPVLALALLRKAPMDVRLSCACLVALDHGLSGKLSFLRALPR